MNSIQELAQWVIDNRYPKSQNDKISDFEMYHTIVDSLTNLSVTKEKEPCENHEWMDLADKTSVCKVCGVNAPF
jgi:hypothetical protein